MRRFLTVMGALLVGCALALGTVARAEDIKALPWHLMDYRYELGQALPFQTLAITLDITADPDAKEYIYICALWGYIGEESFYFGLQSDLHEGLGGRSFTGPGLIFTRWGTGDPVDSRPAIDGWVVPPGPHTPDEGVSLSVRRPFDWGDGRYTFVLQRRPGTDLVLSSWVDLMVFNHQTGQWSDGGGLRFSSSTPALGHRPVTFAEVYGRDRERFGSAEAQAKGLDPVILVIHPWVVDGKVVVPGGHLVQPKKVPGVVMMQQTQRSDGMGILLEYRPEGL
jgi:hypothetical protein